MSEVMIAETCPVCNGRKYVKKGEKLDCCPVEKAPRKPKVKEVTEDKPAE